jgi:hypothetical protein
VAAFFSLEGRAFVSLSPRALLQFAQRKVYAVLAYWPWLAGGIVTAISIQIIGSN